MKEISIIGLGYVGLPLAIEFSKKFPTIGFDIDQLRIKELEQGLSAKTANQVRSILSNILPEYKPDLSSNEPVYLSVKTEAEA